jgi:lysophospholipase L1-like esterase
MEGLAVDFQGGRTADDLLKTLRADTRYPGGAHKKVVVMLGGNDLTVKCRGAYRMRPGSQESLSSQVVETLLECRRLLLLRVPEVSICTLMRRPSLGAPMDSLVRAVNVALADRLNRVGAVSINLFKAMLWAEKRKQVSPDEKNKHYCTNHSDACHLSKYGYFVLIKTLKKNI